MTMKKIEKRDGFTLVEMLIVVAIIAVLIMVSVPLFGSTLEKSRVAVDEANERSAENMAVTWYLSSSQAERDTMQAASGGGKYCLYYYVNPDTHQGTIGLNMDTHYSYDYGCSTKEKRGYGGGDMEIPQGRGIKITMNLDGQITMLEWEKVHP